MTVSQYDTSRSGSSGGYLDFTLRTTALKKFGRTSLITSKY